jgi:large subunit ribosomal protein L5
VSKQEKQPKQASRKRNRQSPLKRHQSPDRSQGCKPKGHQETSRLHAKYGKEVVPALVKHFNYTNVMAVPKLEKIVINMGLGEAVANAKIMDVAVGELGKSPGSVR